MVMNVKEYTIKMRKTFPSASQNSASPYHFTTKALMQLGSYQHIETCPGILDDSQVQDNTGGHHRCDWYIFTPVRQDQVQCRDLEWDEESLNLSV